MAKKLIIFLIIGSFIALMAYALLYAYEHRASIEQFLFTSTETVEDPISTDPVAEVVSMRPFTVEKDTYCSPYPNAPINDSIYVLKEGKEAYLTGRVEEVGPIQWLEVYAERYRPTCWIPYLP